MASEQVTTTYFAIEAKRWESARSIAALVLHTSIKVGLSFKEYEEMGSVEIGGVSFIRFRAASEDVTAMLDAIEGRGLIRVIRGVCQVTFSTGRKGNVPVGRLTTAPCTGQGSKYRGPGQPFAERQFD